MMEKDRESNLTIQQRLHKKGVTWIVLFLIFFFSHPNTNIWFKLGDAFFQIGLIILLVLFIMKVLIPLLTQRRLLLFFTISTFAVVFLTLSSVFLEIFVVRYFGISRYMPSSGSEAIFPFLIRLLWYLVVLGTTVIIHYQHKEEDNRKISDELERGKLDMELRYLKSQINPHFLFNALNNIYSMVYTHDENASEGVLKLSEMLRYVLVDCQADTIPIEKEMKYIENYIDFQLMRIGEDRDVKLEMDIENSGYLLAPMILQPIVENAFKYSGLETNQNGYVHFSIMQSGNLLTFTARNSIKTTVNTILNATDNNSGIGLVNVRKRLELHYGNHYKLEIENDDKDYCVSIYIDKTERSK